MRALDNYNKEKDKNMGLMIGICMKNLWFCSASMSVIWYVLLAVGGGHQKTLLQRLILVLAVTGVMWILYYQFVIRREKKMRSAVAFSILNWYLAIMLLVHPSGMTVLDGLMFGVIVMFPVWTNPFWTKAQMINGAAIVVVRHLVLYFMNVNETGYIQIVSILGMFCVGLMLYYNVKYVHAQTMMLGDATRMDAATGLYNHECFYEELEKRMQTFDQLSQDMREDESFCLLIADIDNFKRVNDTYGHAYGDQVLLGLAGIFKRYCGGKDFAARYGGEEFVLIIGGCHKKDALTRADTIRKKFQNAVFTDATGEEHQFTVSLGVAEYNKKWESASQFFEQADQALYQAKNSGKNRVCSS